MISNPPDTQRRLGCGKSSLRNNGGGSLQTDNCGRSLTSQHPPFREPFPMKPIHLMTLEKIREMFRAEHETNTLENRMKNCSLQCYALNRAGWQFELPPIPHGLQSWQWYWRAPATSALDCKGRLFLSTNEAYNALQRENSPDIPSYEQKLRALANPSDQSDVRALSQTGVRKAGHDRLPGLGRWLVRALHGAWRKASPASELDQ